MPKIAIYNYLTFFIVMYDVLNEPPHLHIYSSKIHSQNSAKIWIESGEFATSGQLNNKDQNLVRKLVENNKKELLNAWKEVLAGQKRKPIEIEMNQLQAMTASPESYVGRKPEIKKVDFSMKGHISIYLKDGRILIAPLSKFPSIKKMSLEQRQQYGLADGTTIIFQYCDEVYHLQDFLGLPEDYIHS